MRSPAASAGSPGCASAWGSCCRSAITVLAILASRAASLQASTGLLYVGLALIMAGSIAGASITYLTGVPV